MNKNQLILNIFLAGGIVTASAQDGAVSDADLLGIGILPSTIPVLDGTSPEDRPIAAGDRNPFSERETEAPQVVQAENEELKIKRMIDSMPVHGGLMHRAGGPKILLGDLILQKGSLVPQIIPDQTEQLVVRELDEEKIELAFLETPQYKGQPRVITVALDIRPTVGQVLSRGTDEYVVQKGRDEMAAEKQLASVLATRATGGSIGTTLPGITVNGKTAKLEKGSGLTSLLRNYGQPGASGITSKPAPATDGSVVNLNPNDGAATMPATAPGAAGAGANAAGQKSEGSTVPFDFGGFPMSPAEGAPQRGSAAPSPSSTTPPESRVSAPTTNAPTTPPLPSFTN